MFIVHSRSTKAYIPLQRESLSVGPRVGQDPQREHFAFGIPTGWYMKSLADPTPTPADPTQTPTNPTPTLADPTRAQRKQVEYRLVGSPRIGTRVGHVHFMLFVSVSGGILALGSRCGKNNPLLSDTVPCAPNRVIKGRVYAALSLRYHT